MVWLPLLSGRHVFYGVGDCDSWRLHMTVGAWRWWSSQISSVLRILLGSSGWDGGIFFLVPGKQITPASSASNLPTAKATAHSSQRWDCTCARIHNGNLVVSVISVHILIIMDDTIILLVFSPCCSTIMFPQISSCIELLIATA